MRSAISRGTTSAAPSIYLGPHCRGTRKGGSFPRTPSFNVSPPTSASAGAGCATGRARRALRIQKRRACRWLQPLKSCRRRRRGDAREREASRFMGSGMAASCGFSAIPHSCRVMEFARRTRKSDLPAWFAGWRPDRPCINRTKYRSRFAKFSLAANPSTGYHPLRFRAETRHKPIAALAGENQCD
jgi:hypothetical protein